MEITVSVASGNALKTLISHLSNILFGRLTGTLGDDFVEVLFHELEDEIEAVFLADDLLELHYVMVVQLAKRLDLTQLHGLVPGGESRFHPLYGHDFVGELVASLGNAAEGSVSNGLYRFIFLHLAAVCYESGSSINLNSNLIIERKDRGILAQFKGNKVSTGWS